MWIISEFQKRRLKIVLSTGIIVLMYQQRTNIKTAERFAGGNSLALCLILFIGLFVDLEKSKDNSKEIDDATEALKKQLRNERTLKIQAVNKLAEIMCRKDTQRENSKKRKAPSDDLRKKEKECRKLHQELGAVS